jgi:hypothetical protein
MGGSSHRSFLFGTLAVDGKALASDGGADRFVAKLR